MRILRSIHRITAVSSTASIASPTATAKGPIPGEKEYGRFGSYFEYTIEKDKPLTVNYRLWLQEGLMQPNEVSALSNNFLDPVKVTVHEPK